MKAPPMLAMGARGRLWINSKEMTARFLMPVVLIAIVGILGGGCRKADDASPSDPQRSSADSTPLHERLPVTKDLNIIVVSFDALRPDVLAPYGGSPETTPHISEFADRSVVFGNAYSVAPVTPTSFASFFSGMLPTKVFRAWRFEADSTLASELSKAGYMTAAFINNVQLTPERGFDKGFELYDWRRNHPDEEFIRDILSWIEVNKDRKFFVWTHFLHPHAPYRVVPGAHHLYSGEDHGRFSETTGNTFQTTEEHEIARIKDLYLGEVWTADRLFGELIDTLQQTGLMQSSIVVLISDHGEEFSEHGGFQHGRLYEEHLRVPLILYHPHATPGHIDDVRTRGIDLFPTLLHLVGQPLERAVDGEDLFLHTGGESPPMVGISMTGEEERWVSVLDGPHKLILACGPEKRVELFNLETDPLEQNNIAAAHRETVGELLQILGAQLGGAPCEMVTRAVKGKDQTDGLDAESLEALKALGYID